MKRSKSKYRTNLSAERLREVLNYNPRNGVFTWRIMLSKNVPAGSVAGFVTQLGYRTIKIDGQAYQAHRLAFLYMTGEWPVDQVDHMDGDGTNNRWRNLREASASLNQQNKRRGMSNNKTGLLGVSPCKEAYKATISIRGKVMHLGTFKRAEDAYAAYVDAKRKHHEGCTL
jgi:hypothetical protein